MKKSLIKTICLLLSFLLCFIPYCIVIQNIHNKEMMKFETSQEEDALELCIYEETVPVVELKIEKKTTKKQPLSRKYVQNKIDILIEEKELMEKENMIIIESAAPAEMIAETETSVETMPETTIAETAQPQIYLGQYRITFYCNCQQCCGQWAYMGVTASGAPLQAYHTIACGEDIPFGTIIYIEGLGTYVCEDRGVPSGCIDVYVNNHGEIPSWGAAYINCYIVQ